jgi:hypothetical protein
MEAAWLIERNGEQLCFGKACDGVSLLWVTFSDPGALRFTTKEKADEFIHHHCLAHLSTAVSHGWVDSVPREQVGRGTFDAEGGREGS